MAVEPHSLAWVAGQRGPDRSGDSWCELLAHWPCVERVITDAGKGRERLVEAAAKADAKVAQRQQSGRDARGVARQAWLAWHKAEHVFDETVLAEAIAEQVAVALGLFRPEGDFNDRQWAQAQTLVWRKSLQSLSNFSRIELLMSVHTFLSSKRVKTLVK
jgi:hypothetical protein